MRRMIGRRLIPGAIGFAAFVSLTACADLPDEPGAIRQCALRQGPDGQSVIVEDWHCGGTAGGNAIVTPGYGWYYTPIYSGTDTRLYGPGTRVGGGSFSPPPNVKVENIKPAPPIARGASTVQRGGFGIKGGGTGGS